MVYQDFQLFAADVGYLRTLIFTFWPSL